MLMIDVNVWVKQLPASHVLCEVTETSIINSTWFLGFKSIL